MQPRNLLVMSVVVLALGAFIFFYEKDLPSTDDRAKLEKKVVAVESDEVEAVEIAWQGRTLRLEREAPADGEDGETATAGAGWRIVTPLAARADTTAVDSLLTSLTGLEKERRLEGVEDADVGLDEPEVEVTLVTDGGDQVLRVGAEVPASSDRIVAFGGAVYQVGGSFVDSLTKEPGEWRDKKVFTAARADVERLTLTAGEQKVLLAKRGEDFWIESPITDRADEDHVNDLMSQVTGLRVREFVDESSLDLAAFGLDPPQGVLEVVLEGQEEPFLFELGQPSEDGDVVHGRAAGQLFEIETELGESFARSPAEWRSRAWTALEVFKIESARLQDAAGTLEVTRDGADWKRGDERIDYSTASDLFYAVTDAGADEVVERAVAESRGHRFDEPSLSIDLVTKEGEEKLSLYALVGGLAAATSDGRDTVLLLPASAVTEIRDKVEAVRTAKALADEDEEAGEGADDAELED